MKSAPLALLTLAFAAAAAWPLSHLGAAPAGTARPAVEQTACVPERAEGAPGPRALALPPGHPRIDIQGLLPPGHPPIPGVQGALPPGHPELPPGHPPIPSSPRGMPLPFGEPVLLET
ncbi:MAG TPA: hypothetical protein VF875_04575 [Anaeromyxobacter sp.]